MLLVQVVNAEVLEEKFKQKYGKEWNVEINDNTNSTKRLIGYNIDIKNKKTEAKSLTASNEDIIDSTLKDFTQNNSDFFKINIEDLEKDKIDALEKVKEKVRIIDEDNSWVNTINPFHGLWKGLKRLFGWVFAFVLLGGLLKVGSIFFPQLEIIRWIGRILVHPFKLFLMWIPEAFRALGAVPHAEFLKEKELADRTVGAIQELKDSSTDAYAALRPKLLDWMKDRPEFKEIVDQKLIALNLK
mgnify:CR=1 FL=1